MATCVLLKQTKFSTVVLIAGVRTRLADCHHEGFKRLMELEGSAQDAYDRLMDLEVAKPWSVASRLGRRIMRLRILGDESLGVFHSYTELRSRRVRAFRTTGRTSTSLVYA